MTSWYPAGMRELDADEDWVLSTIKVALHTGAFTFDETDATVTAVGLSEPSGATNYARQTLPSRTVTAATGIELVTFAAGEVDFGRLGDGDADPLPTATAVLGFIDNGTDGTSIPLFVDTGFSTIVASSPGAVTDTTLYVDPIPDDLANGTIITISSNAVALTAPATRLDRSLTLAALTNVVALAAVGSAPVASGLPSQFNGGPWFWQF